MARLVFLLLGVLLAVSACSGDPETAESTLSTADVTTTTAPATSTTTATPETTATTTVADVDEEVEANLLAAEAFVDAFYSFDRTSLEDQFAPGSEGPPFWLYYQGWAEGANYEVLNRESCEPNRVGVIKCAITVRDDLLLALGLDFNVTDTFEFEKFSADGAIDEVHLSSNDPDLVDDAFDWARAAYPEHEAGVCLDAFQGGPTPAACADAFVEGFMAYAVSDDFPGTP